MRNNRFKDWKQISKIPCLDPDLDCLSSLEQYAVLFFSLLDLLLEKDSGKTSPVHDINFLFVQYLVVEKKNDCLLLDSSDTII